MNQKLNLMTTMNLNIRNQKLNLINKQEIKFNNYDKSKHSKNYNVEYYEPEIEFAQYNELIENKKLKKTIKKNKAQPFSQENQPFSQKNLSLGKFETYMNQENLSPNEFQTYINQENLSPSEFETYMEQQKTITQYANL